jgi:hypothetical protein
VPQSVQPTLDVGHEWPINRQFALATNFISTSSVSVAQLPSPRQGVHRVYWYAHLLLSDITGVSLARLNFFTPNNSVGVTILTYLGSGISLNAMPLLGTSSISSNTDVSSAVVPKSFYLRSNEILTCSVTAGGTAPGTGVMTVRAAYVDLESFRPILIP